MPLDAVRSRATSSGFRALIQLAAANLKLFMGNRRAGQNLLHRGLVRLQRVPGSYMGVDIAGFTEEVRQQITHTNGEAPCIRLAMPGLEIGAV
jgi:hypothetical protein